MNHHIQGRDKWAQFDDSNCTQISAQDPNLLTEDLFKDLSHPVTVGLRTHDDDDDRIVSSPFIRTTTDQPVPSNPANPLFQRLPDANQKMPIPGSTGRLEQTTPAQFGFRPPVSATVGLPAATAPRTELWNVSSEQRAYYLSQFLRLQSDPRAKLAGSQAKMFFELSKLPTSELSDIWELSDVDRDGQLTLNEFVVAMHLVVLRRNGVPIPQILPDALMEVITSQSLSTLVPAGVGSALPCSFDSLETMSSTVDQPDTFPQATGTVLFTNVPRPWHGSPPATTTCFSVAQTPIYGRQRRWSISSQSDISSLAEGIMHFEAKPNADGHLQHPIPVRARTLPMGSFGTDTAQHYQFETTPLRVLAVEPNDPLIHTCSPEHIGRENAGEKIGASMPKSTPPPLPPPPPPPRAHVAGHRHTAGGDALQSQLTALNCRCLETEGDAQWPGIRSGAVAQIKTDHVDDGNVINLNKLADLIRANGSEAVIAQLQRECDEVMQTNDQLASELMQLQQHRIALKILLERLMPLEGASYPC